jgi:hypothetical protein
LEALFVGVAWLPRPGFAKFLALGRQFATSAPSHF